MQQLIYATQTNDSPVNFFSLNSILADNYNHAGNYGYNGGYRQGGRSGRGIC